MRYNYTQQYMLVANLARAFCWLAVLSRLLILLPLTGVRFLAGGIADFFFCINVGCILVDAFDYWSIFSKVPTSAPVSRPSASTLVLSVLEHAVVTGVVLSYPKVAKSNAFAALVGYESVAELVRYYYNFYKVRTFGMHHATLKVIKKLCYTVMVPLQVVMEMTLIFNSLQFSSYYELLDVNEKWVRLAVRVVLLFYLPLFYTVYKRKIYEYWYVPFVATEHSKDE